MNMAELRAAVRASAPLEVRLERCITLIGAIASGRDMRMTVPPLPTDDDMLLCETLAEARQFVAAAAGRDAVVRAAQKWGDTESDDKVAMLTAELELSNALVALPASSADVSGVAGGYGKTNGEQTLMPPENQG